MAEKDLIMKLARVIIALAWADGEITNEEVNSLKDLLYRLPSVGYSTGIQLSAREWARLDMYLEKPVGPEERTRLVAELQNALRSRRDKELVSKALRNLVAADDTVTEDEAALVAEIEEAVNEVQVGLLGGLGRLVGRSVDERSATVAGAPDREAFFEDFLKNKVYYALVQRRQEGQMALDLTDEEERTLGLAGGLMAKVAHVDKNVTDQELAAMADTIQRHWALDDDQAAFVAEVAASAVHAGYDALRMMREFTERTTLDERRHFVEALFAVAAADGEVSHDEHEEIRHISRSLLLTHRDFIDAKLAARDE